jgi:hypothetical protein
MVSIVIGIMHCVIQPYDLYMTNCEMLERYIVHTLPWYQRSNSLNSLYVYLHIFRKCTFTAAMLEHYTQKAVSNCGNYTYMSNLTSVCISDVIDSGQLCLTEYCESACPSIIVVYVLKATCLAYMQILTQVV